MARIRTVKPEFWSSGQVVECSPNARLLFIGMWNFCDDSGIHKADAARLKMEVFPGDGFKSMEIQGWIDELLAHGLIHEYEVGEQVYWQVTGWKHQKIDKPYYRLPLPDGTVPRSWNSPNGSRIVADRSTTIRPRKGDVVEGKGKVVTTKPPSAALVVFPDWWNPGIQSVWDDYRKQRGPKFKPEYVMEKLTRLRTAGNDPLKVLRQSLENGWQGLFAVKEDENGRQSEYDRATTFFSDQLAAESGGPRSLPRLGDKTPDEPESDIPF